MSEHDKPVAWRYQNANTDHTYLVWDKGAGGRNWTPLYTRPAQWVGLTDEERDGIYTQHHNQYGECESPDFGYERAIEAALKEKNT